MGTADSFYQQGQLLPENFLAAAKAAGLGDSVTLRYHEVRRDADEADDRDMITAIISLARLQKTTSFMPPSILSR